LLLPAKKLMSTEGTMRRHATNAGHNLTP
jgi:hypothetical protein